MRVIARRGPGLPDTEIDPSGFEILRVPVSAIGGLPLPEPARRWLARRWASRSRRNAPRAGTDAEPAPHDQPDARGLTRHARHALARLARPARSGWRMAAIVLTVRAQARAAATVDHGADVYHGMAYMGVPVALELARRRPGARVVYDARDIYVDAQNLARLPAVLRAVLGRSERGWARASARVVTVNHAYAAVMASRWRVPLPAVVMNCSDRYEPPDPRPRRFHEALGLDAQTRIVLYHGGFSPERGIEHLVAAIAGVRDATLVLLGYGALQAQLEAIAADPSTGGRVRILPAVPPRELLDWVASADVAAMPIQPTTLNHRLTTPNKLFEAMAAGVPVVAGDLPGMAGIVRETGCGLVCDPTDVDAIAAAIRGILDAADVDRATWRAKALSAARETYNWESQVSLLLHEYGRLTGRPW